MKLPISILAAIALPISGVHAALVSQYTFDDSGNLGDDSQNNAEGTNTGISAFNDAQRGAVAQFSGGATPYIHSSIDLSGGEFTISMWVKSTSWNNNRGLFQVQLAAGTTVDTNGNNKVVGAWVNTSGNPWGRIIDTGGTKTMAQAGPSLTTGGSAAWHHLAYRAQGSFFQAFLDGTLITENEINNYNGTLANHANLIIGRQGDEAWNGLIDDFRVYDNALSDGEVAALAIPEPSPVMLLGCFSLLALLRRRR